MMRATRSQITDDEQPTLNLNFEEWQQKAGTQPPSKARTQEEKKRANHRELTGTYIFY